MLATLDVDLPGVRQGVIQLIGLGDAATFDAITASLRVLKGCTLFVVSVEGHSRPLEAATTLARRALARIPDDAGSGSEDPPSSATKS